jgi:hypothetical protein
VDENTGPKGALRELQALVAPPTGGGDVVDWEQLYESSGVRLPDDFKQFVASYGGGEFNSYMAIIIPPAEGYPYGGEWHGVPEELDLNVRAEVPTWLRGLKVLSYGGNVHGDQIYWLCNSEDPNAWETLVFKRQHQALEEPWKRFSMGMVQFWVSLLRGDFESPFSLRTFPGVSASYTNWREDDMWRV